MNEAEDLYRTLEPSKVLDTLTVLGRRVEERFPGSGLSRICAALVDLAEETEERCAWIARPNLWLRGGVALVIAAILASLVAAVIALVTEAEVSRGLTDLLQGSEAALNEVALIGAAIFFLVSVETRIKRSRALKSLHDLRALAHVIDMHQLTKDPERLRRRGPDTESSPTHTLSHFELTRYLDYCSEMSSIVGKIAALYASRLQDPVVLDAVNEIEHLTTSLSTKVWQKITILQDIEQS
jgi:hypothetical protein